VGTFAVQIAKAMGAQVTGVCHTRNLDWVRALGADLAMDYTREDFTRNGRRYELILAVGGNRSIFDYRRSLAPSGRYVLVGDANAQFYQALLLAPWLSLPGRRKLGTMLARPRAADLETLGTLLEAGKVRPVIDRRYPLRHVPKAVGYVESGLASGKVIITL
jgi:NADPH:quinone reductase-like Zn-dependent oxidoreductase